MKNNSLSQTQTRLPRLQRISRDCHEIVYYTLPVSKNMNINRSNFLERMAEWDLITQHYQQSLKHLRSELSRVEQRERSRLAGELHDYLAQMLVISKMKLDSLKRKIDSESSRSIIQELEELLDQSINFTRTLMSDLSPRILQEEGLLAALQKLAEQMKHHGLEVILEHEIQELSLGEEKTVQLYQMIRELLFNVLKHAQVNQAKINLSVLDSNKLVITVIDDGIGFSVPQDIPDHCTQNGFGLWSIGERMESLGGEYHIQSAPDQGSRISLTIPLDTKNSN